MEKVFIACSMLSEEIQNVTEELGLVNRILYIDAALHVDLDKLKSALDGRLGEVKKDEQPAIVIGNKCHPDIQRLADKHGAKVAGRSNCIELLLGDKMKELDQESKTFYITNGWLKNWRKIFVEGLQWDRVDARQNFGYYDRILLLNTGLSEVSDEDILEFFEYTQVPVEIFPVTLEHFKQELLNLAG
ncbi:MAG: DUF1638 domain-containing protein [Eubacteriales bacterium]